MPTNTGKRIGRTPAVIKNRCRYECCSANGWNRKAHRQEVRTAKRREARAWKAEVAA